eukprot:COSAG02_NODE_23761_length_709_cov_0.844262_2_plen_35_part_01
MLVALVSSVAAMDSAQGSELAARAAQAAVGALARA